MNFIKLFKSKKKQKKAEEAAQAPDRAFFNFGNPEFTVNEAEIDPPETRMTDEYKAFLEEQEAKRCTVDTEN